MPEDWAKLLKSVVTSMSAPVRAQTFVKKFPTASSPVLLRCDDGNDYVVKGSQAGRMIITDQVVGRIGIAAQAPVAEIELVDVPEELVAAEPEMAHMTAGISHGSRWIPDCSEQAGFDHAHVPENRPRFARLAFLYGWVIAHDHQFIYSNQEPRLVYSVDHGHFLAGSTGWTIDTLKAAPEPAADSQVVGECVLTEDELEAVKKEFGIDDEAVASAVVAPPQAWGITDEERVALSDYLASRRDVMFEGEGKDGDEG
jgi:HipA-like protein